VNGGDKTFNKGTKDDLTLQGPFGRIENSTAHTRWVPIGNVLNKLYRPSRVDASVLSDEDLENVNKYV
jgi:hypothetical protein